MKFILICFFLFTLSWSENVCGLSENYLKITKRALGSAANESFEILSSNTVIYTSPTLVSNQDRVIETCLPTTTNQIYTLRMKGTNSWANGAWIMIEGVNGNRVFKQMMTSKTEEDYQFSLYSPINMGSTWKYSNTEQSNWNQAAFADSDWTDITTGTTTQVAVGTQYFRHLFAGRADHAAIDVQFNYRYGVIAYINGVEIYRDNMPEGVATVSTPAQASYSTASLHGVIRPSSIASNPSSVLAVEVHPTGEMMTTEEVIVFNGFLSFLAGIYPDNQCFVLPYDPVVAGEGFSTSDYAFSWTRTSRAYSSSGESPNLIADYSMYSSVPMLNALRVWTYTSATSAATVFTLEGSNVLSGTYTKIYQAEGVDYEASEWKQFNRVSTAQPYKYYRFTGYESNTSVIGVVELQFMICNIEAPEVISYTQKQTSFFVNYEFVNQAPDHYGFENCQVSPALPAGVTLNPQDCFITGTPTEGRASTVYTITGHAGTVTATGTVTFTFTECTASMYKIVRSYKTNPQYEYFRIYDTATSSTIYEVLENHNHPASIDWVHYICIVPERFDVVFYGVNNYWVSNSYFYLYYLLPNEEMEMIVKGRYDANHEADTNVFVRRPHVGHSQPWYYKFDSVPANWHSSDVSGWSQAARGSFPTASNKIQLYKKTFTVNNLSEVKGYILSIRYKYGCVVYLNGQEAWRNGVSGDVAASPVAENVYTDLLYRVVTLPGKSIPTTAQPTAISYLQQGTNTIAIALVALDNTQTTTDFDCIVRLMTSEEPESHIWEMTGTITNMSGAASSAFNMYYGNSIYYSGTDPCTTNSVEITLNNDRREWVSSAHIQSYYQSSTSYVDVYQFNLYGRNPEDDGWTLLRNVTGLQWSIPGQKHFVYFQNNKSYNQFRFENIFPPNHDVQCKWRVSSFDLYADNTVTDIAPLTYPETVEVYKDIEMSEIIPVNSAGYFDFTIQPPLPSGMAFDSQTGWISGTPLNYGISTYTITAYKVSGGTGSAVVNISVNYCTGGRSLVTVRIRADAYNTENSWKLYEGRGTDGTILQEVSPFPVKSTYYYLDFCLVDNIYTFEAEDSYGDGWTVNCGYTLTADVGELEFEIMEMQNGEEKPVKVSTVFSSYFPFQFEYSDWKVNQLGFVEGWTATSFDDSAWSTMKASEIPTTEQVTTYLRKVFTIPNVADYHILNIRLKYTGGVACYLNGNKVALFNMVEDFDPNTESIDVHDASISAKFHILLRTNGMVEGDNVIAFEIHRPAGASSAEPVVFDATGVFGVDDCSVVVDSFAEIDSTEPNDGTLAGIMDLDPFTTGTLPNNVGTYIQWSVDNLLGSKWNAFNIHGGVNRNAWGFEIRGTMNINNNSSSNDNEMGWVTLFSNADLEVKNREKMNLQAPIAIAGFRTIRWEVIETSTNDGSINAFYLTYCTSSVSFCPAIDNYQAVEEGQISPSTCPEGYTGYSYRECNDGQFGEIKLDHCELLPPVDATYKKSKYEFVMQTQVTTGIPEVKNIVARWYVDEGVILPAGLVLNEMTGEITGIPEKEMEMTTYTVYAENQSGATLAVISIMVRKGQCKAEGVFSSVEVGNTAIYKCEKQGYYVGTMERKCSLGDVDGEWESATGLCISIILLVSIICVGIAVIVIVISMILRLSKRKTIKAGKKAMKKSKIVNEPKKEMSIANKVSYVC